MKRSVAVSAAAVLLIGVGAAAAIAANRDPNSSAGGTPTITLEEMRFTPNRIDAKVGRSLTVRLVNRGTQRHDLNLPASHMPGLAGAEAILEPGETRTLTLRFEQAGEHTFICTLPGHAAAGMTGAVFVRP